MKASGSKQSPIGRQRAIVSTCIGLLMIAASANASERLTYLAQPDDGFQAIRFNRRIELRDFNIRNDAIIQPGATLLQDRYSNELGKPLWCGPISTNGDGVLMTWCFVWDGTSLQSAVGTYLGRPVAPPSNSFSILTVRF